MAALRFCIICYGEEHVDLLEQVAVRSLTQPRNGAAIPADAVAVVYSDAASIDRVAACASRLGRVEPHVIALTGDHYIDQVGAFVEEIGNCVRADAGMVMVSPDCFWGDGSLANLLFVAGEQNVCIASPHVRVDRDRILDELRTDPGAVYTNPALVSLAMRTLHPSWCDADTMQDEANSFHTGIGMRSAWPLHFVHHLQPTVFYARPTARDYGFFAERKEIRGLWDHYWPSVLVADQRLRVVASSDAIFIAELTDAGTHNMPKQKIDRVRPDAFHRDAPHIAANRGIVAVWRENVPG